MKKIGILGGSFNPVHNGHLHLAGQALNALGLDRLDLAPAARPPHKPKSGLLDFKFREKLLNLAISGRPGLRVNPLESLRQGPSYTYDTLLDYQARESTDASALFFLLGAADLLSLPDWYKGTILPTLANFVVAPRAELGPAEIERFILSNPFGQTTPEPPPVPAALKAWRPLLPDKSPAPTLIILLPLKRLDISSSMVRELWRENQNLAPLLPPAVLQELQARKQEVNAAWS